MESAKRNSIRELYQKVNASAIRAEVLPLQMVAGWPFIHKKGGEICVSMPFYKKYEDGGRTYLYPLSAVLTMRVSDGIVISYNNLLYDKEWKEVAFDTVCGEFKHKAISSLNYGQYQQAREKLFDLFDELLSSYLDSKAFDKQTEMKQLFSVLMEPGEYPYYIRLAPKFFENFCGVLA